MIFFRPRNGPIRVDVIRLDICDGHSQPPGYGSVQILVTRNTYVLHQSIIVRNNRCAEQTNTICRGVFRINIKSPSKTGLETPSELYLSRHKTVCLFVCPQNSFVQNTCKRIFEFKLESCRITRLYAGMSKERRLRVLVLNTII